ncbi:MAG: hypothetical protein AB1505_17255 [Candidatus Latescibacterota bacterium]
MARQEMSLRNEYLGWHLAWDEGPLRSLRFENGQSGRAFPLDGGPEVALLFSAAPDRLAEPYTRVADFAVVRAEQPSPDRATLHLHSPTAGLPLRLHYQLDGPTRRKWVTLESWSGPEALLLDVELDDFGVEAPVEGGGQGQPLLLSGEAFAAVEHPSGLNQAEGGRIRLGHCPGRRLAAGDTWQRHVALVSAAPPGEALAHFLDYIQARCRRRQRFQSVYTPFGINNQWGACPTLSDEETLEVLRLLERWQRKGVRFDYFTLDTGWVDPASDLTRFKPTCYPDGPGEVVARVQALGMRLGLWFGTSWGTQSCWEYAPAYADGRPPGLPYRDGYPQTLGGITFCLGWEPYYQLLKRAVLHHITQNGVRFLKFDGGMYHCDSTEHGHLPGCWAVEAMHEKLIDLAAAAREAASDVFVMWYWGLRSPFWALHGDTIFESGLHMEGSGTSAHPTLYYRDSVTLAQDHNAQHARTIPPLAKDSLGVWLADTRWGNFMGRERWREALVMDLGRANLLFPNLWGNLFHLSDADRAFLAYMQRLAHANESLFLRRRTILGDPARNEVYGYACGQGRRAFVFVNNAHFASRPAVLRLDASLGLEGRPGTPFHVRSHFPEATRLLPSDGTRFRWGDAVEVWLRPFEVLMLEVSPRARGTGWLPVRSVDAAEAAALGVVLPLRDAPLAEGMEVTVAEAERFRQMGHRPQVYAYASALPDRSAVGEDPGPQPRPQPILAVVVRLRQGQDEWRYSPVVVEIVQVLVRVGGHPVQLVPVPDGRQFGNTQKAGCSWVVYRTRLGHATAGADLRIAVHAWLPQDVEARVEAWVVDRWWAEEARPSPDGYYTYAPS